MSVIMLSENYANSTACLFELQTILELCKKSDHFLLPVFYEVEPEVLKGQSENLVFENKEATAERVKGWSHALKEVALMTGKVFRKKSDGYLEDSVKKREVDPFEANVEFSTELISSRHYWTMIFNFTSWAQCLLLKGGP